MSSKSGALEEEGLWSPDWASKATAKDKFFGKMKREPMVPIGSILTGGALIVASRQLFAGNRGAFNRALRWRIYFQGLTAVAALAGVYIYGLAENAPSPSTIAVVGEDGKVAGSLSALPPYSNISTVPGRPATILQVNKQGDREAQSRMQWEERMKRAQKRELEARDQRKLEAALLRGTGLLQGPGRREVEADE